MHTLKERHTIIITILTSGAEKDCKYGPKRASKLFYDRREKKLINYILS